MSIFKRHDQGGVKEAPLAPRAPSADGAQHEQPTRTGKLTPPFSAPPTARAAQSASAPGVVPPPAAPIYSMRPPEAPQADEDAQSSLAEKLRMAGEALQRMQESVQGGVQGSLKGGLQGSVQGNLEVAVQRRRTAPSSATRVRRSSAQRPAEAARAPRTQAHQPFDPMRAAQAGLLSLAWSWQEAGAPIRAIHTYVELLTRYPGTPAAAAAVADLVKLSEKLSAEGQFHTALTIYDHLECLA
jgi:hypothetical protein